jgi:hypothetical protein
MSKLPGSTSLQATVNVNVDHSRCRHRCAARTGFVCLLMRAVCDWQVKFVCSDLKCCLSKNSYNSIGHREIPSQVSFVRHHYAKQAVFRPILRIANRNPIPNSTTPCNLSPAWNPYAGDAATHHPGITACVAQIAALF